MNNNIVKVDGEFQPLLSALETPCKLMQHFTTDAITIDTPLRTRRVYILYIHLP